jgi:hypothetical protein
VESSYFRLEEVADGVYAAVVTPGVGRAMQDLDAEHDYLLYIEALARSILRGERMREEALAEASPPPFESGRGQNVLADNLTFCSITYLGSDAA